MSSASTVIRSHVWVSGRVQGVFYRGTCVERAVAAGARGWVKNLRDGRVEAVFEGDPSTVTAMVEWCRHGPPGAAVTELEIRSETPVGEPAGFRIAR